MLCLIAQNCQQKLGRFVLSNKSTDLLSCELLEKCKNVHITRENSIGVMTAPAQEGHKCCVGSI